LLSSVVGQIFAKSSIKSIVRSGRVPYGLLFYGPPSVGKYTSAMSLARYLNCLGSQQDTCECRSCRKVVGKSHTDVRFIDPSESGEIALKQIRDLISGFEYRLHEGKKKVCIIRRADQMNAFSTNALLKVLEEPKGDAVIILTSSAPGRLLDTVRSRCQAVRFSYLTDNNLSEICRNNRIEVDVVDMQVMGGVFRPTLLVDELKVLQPVCKGQPSRSDIKLESDSLRRELIYLACVFGLMLKTRTYSYKEISLVRANADKVSQLVELIDESVMYLDRGVRPLLVLKRFEGIYKVLSN